ncbi:hypothetical protein [Desulfosporosinus hippei]|uniref:Uncharacterized protein n=1 Tax=Desulfosporosinus hippei DSM 8344 TaxID=1121419 RepID=A0A1G8CH61_9FIRM|nr:hypothetical protein [Desulfosporosinus hippei]SDH44794.1 hypothetical protein SAMN05443529_113100 [Desulfosporosinus hippei DSM 8344]
MENRTKAKKSLMEVLGSLTPECNSDIDIDEAIKKARIERAKHIVRKMKNYEPINTTQTERERNGLRKITTCDPKKLGKLNTIQKELELLLIRLRE